jgi:protocatechuate 3,4-dioxygenase beta subunit
MLEFDNIPQHEKYDQIKQQWAGWGMMSGDCLRTVSVESVNCGLYDYQYDTRPEHYHLRYLARASFAGEFNVRPALTTSSTLPDVVGYTDKQTFKIN